MIRHTNKDFAIVIALLFAFATLDADAQDGGLDYDDYVEMAAEAVQVGEYLAAARNWVEAAERSESADDAQKATRFAYSFGFDAEALQAAERWLELDRDNEQALIYVAQLQLRDGQVRQSKRNFKRVLKLSDGAEDERLLSFVSLLSEDDPVVAYELLRDLAKPYKDSASAHYAVAVMAMSADEIDTAVERAKAAVDLDPEWLKAKLLYGRTLLFAGKEDEAIDYTARIIGDDPDPDPEARMELALLFMSVGRNDDALSQVNQVLLEQPGRADALRLMAIINFREERYDAAWSDFEDLLSTRRYTSDALFYLARISDIREEVDRAIRLYAGVKSGPNAVPAQRRASALMAFENDNPEQALAMLDSFAQTSPSNAIDVVLAKAQLLASMERYDDSMVYYDRFVDFRPNSENGLLGRAELLLRMDRIDDAIAQYRQSAERFPESATSLNALGYTLADRSTSVKDWQEAEVLIRKALDKDPDNAAIIDSMGWVLFRLGQPEAALVELERAYASFDDPEVAAHIVEVLHTLQRTDEAMTMLESAEEKDPDNELLEAVRQRLFPDAD
ncbi:MAG: tetratricopeptide repeat protein [Pseudomonadota bacterium]